MSSEFWNQIPPESQTNCVQMAEMIAQPRRTVSELDSRVGNAPENSSLPPSTRHSHAKHAPIGQSARASRASRRDVAKCVVRPQERTRQSLRRNERHHHGDLPTSSLAAASTISRPRCTPISPIKPPHHRSRRIGERVSLAFGRTTGRRLAPILFLPTVIPFS